MQCLIEPEWNRYFDDGIINPIPSERKAFGVILTLELVKRNTIPENMLRTYVKSVYEYDLRNQLTGGPDRFRIITEGFVCEHMILTQDSASYRLRYRTVKI